MDRMEVIYISGYTEDEKLNIAKKYLLPKSEAYGLKKSNLRIQDQTIRDIITTYTRNLEFGIWRGNCHPLPEGGKGYGGENKKSVTIHSKTYGSS